MIPLDPRIQIGYHRTGAGDVQGGPDIVRVDAQDVPLHGVGVGLGDRIRLHVQNRFVLVENPGDLWAGRHLEQELFATGHANHVLDPERLENSALGRQKI